MRVLQFAGLAPALLLSRASAENEVLNGTRHHHDIQNDCAIEESKDILQLTLAKPLGLVLHSPIKNGEPSNDVMVLLHRSHGGSAHSLPMDLQEKLVGSRIVAINNESTSDMEIRQVVDWITNSNSTLDIQFDLSAESGKLSDSVDDTPIQHDDGKIETEGCHTQILKVPNSDQTYDDSGNCVIMSRIDCTRPQYGKNAQATGKLDRLHLGRCHYRYNRSQPPKKGYLEDIDFFHLRESHIHREECFLYCIDQLEPAELNDSSLLVHATVMGLPSVVKKLKTQYGLDPLYYPTAEQKYNGIPGFNAIQEAIRGGYAEIVKILTDSNTDLLIDRYGRTVADYVRMKGSPIRPMHARSILGLTVDKDASERNDTTTHHQIREYKSGWKKGSTVPQDVVRCDIDVRYDDMSRKDFYRDYFMTGRPVILRGQIPYSEMKAFRKSRWEQTSRFHPSTPVKVGPTAYPSLTGQQRCMEKMTIEDIENSNDCENMPGVPMVHARHPSDDDFVELYPYYEGDAYDPTGGWRKLEEWFAPSPWNYHLTWQLFFGGDSSGATIHWHNAAMNVLYVGTKTWTITPPSYRGLTGMPARKATATLDPAIALKCIQRAGDMMYIPDYWGHLTLNQAFSIGAAVVMSRDFTQHAHDDDEEGDVEGVHNNTPKKVFFVHINKCGGTSMIQMLGQSCPDEYVRKKWEDGHRSFHASAHSFIDHFGRAEWEQASTFAIVRHPLARMVSNFFFLIDLCQENRRQFCDDRLVPKDVYLDSMTDTAKIDMFHSYVLHLYNVYPPGSKQHYLFGSRGHGNESFDTFNATQTSWLVDEDGTIAVKNVYHLETLNSSMKDVRDAIPCLSESGRDSDTGGDSGMLHVNASPKYPDYRLFGKNQRINKIMKEVFAVDFDNFGYKLE